jgi:signal transduction histidine kinase/ActR/RegA family two-component response regulator
MGFWALLRKEFNVPLLLLAAVIGGLFWVADSAINSLVFSESSFADAALRPEPMELWVRGLMIAMLMAFAFHIENLMRRYQEARDAAEAAAETKSRFLANMSHEIRTPMTAILGYAEGILEGGDLTLIPPERLHAVDAIKRNGSHLLQIINDILDVSKIEAGRLGIDHISFSVVEIVGEVASMMRIRVVEKGLGVVVEYPTALPETVKGDPTRIRQILVNLVSNAIKFTERGVIRLVTRLIDEPTNTSIQFEVIDSGIGLSEEQVALVFKPFTQADGSTTRTYGGTGLGLTICNHLVAALGGTIEVESALGSGSTFRVTLPLEALEGVPLIENPSDVVKAAACGSEESLWTGSLDCRILLAEDAPDNQRLIQQILQQAGAEVSIADNGHAALERALEAREDGQPFDVILMDMQMPVLDGYEATRALRRADYDLPIIALTAHAMSTDRDRCLAAGCNDFATKPIDRASLIRVLAHSVGKRDVPA